MSLEECKRLAEESREREKELWTGRRHSGGEVEGEQVDVYFSKNPILLYHHQWIVVVSAYGELSTKYFKHNEKDSAEKYFEKLTKDYGLQEEKK